jgi:hypothetical protein
LTLAAIPLILVQLRTINRAIVAVVLALSIGVQWPLLQSIAWLNMLVTFSAQEGIQQAVTKTFDGKHPCKLCKFVNEGKQAEKKKDTQHSLKKFDPMLVTAVEVRIEGSPSAAMPSMSPVAVSRSYPPLSPPPDLI